MKKIYFFLFISWLILFNSLDIYAQNEDDNRLKLNPGYGFFGFNVATSYQMFKYPWDYPIDYPMIEVNTSLPVRINRWNPDLSGILPEDYFGINPEYSPIFDLGFMPSTSVQVSMPYMWDKIEKNLGIKGAISAGYSKNLDFSVDFRVYNFVIDKYPANYEDVPLRFRVIMNAPLFYYMRWNSFYVNYTIAPSDNVRLAFQLSRNTFQLKTNSLITMDFSGYAEVNNSIVPIAYNLPDREGDEVYAYAKGDYVGTKWMTVMGIKASFISWILRMGTTVKLEGLYEMGYSLPFFIIPDSLWGAVTGELSSYDDSNFIDWDALTSEPARIGNGEVVSRGYYTTDPAYGIVPTNFTLGVDIIPGYLEFSWTHFTGPFVLKHIDHNNTFFSMNGYDTLATYGRQNFYLYVKIDDIFLIRSNLKYYNIKLGLMNMHIKFQEGQSDDYFLPIIPILGAGVETKSKYELFLNGFILPIPSIRGGVRIYLEK